MADNPQKSWIREIVLGVTVAVIAAAVVAELNLDKSRGAASGNTASFDPAIAPMIPIDSPAIVGQWEQLLFDPYTQQWQHGGFYQVSMQNQGLTMAILDTSQVGPAFTNTRGITDVTFDGMNWSFNSHLDTGQVVQFVLQGRNQDLYEGYAYLDGVASALNSWRRVQ
jgi:hypothetical protein